MSLVLQTALRTAVNDVEQLFRLYGLLVQTNVPFRIQTLFEQLKGSHIQLLELKTALQTGKIGYVSDHHVTTFKRFSDQLLDLELFIDPEQAIPRSGPGSETQNTISWMGPGGPDVDIFCQTFEPYISGLDQTCKAIMSNSENKPTMNGISQDHISTGKASTLNNHYFGYSAPLVSPLLTPFKESIFGSPFAGVSPITSPMASPFINPQGPQQLPPIASLFNLGDLPPIDISGGHTLANLPSLNSSTLQRPRKSEKRKAKTIAERRVQELIESRFGKPMTAGVKRKRQIQDHSPSPGLPQHVSERSLTTRTPPPTYEAPDSPRLGPYNPPDEFGHSDRGDLGSGTVWSSLDDLVDALPPTSPSQTQNKGKGKQRADETGDTVWETASSINTGSTGTTISSRDSVREGSIFSTASRERTFDEGACTLFVKPFPSHHPNAPRGKPIQLSVAHLEVRRTTQGQGRGIVIVARTTNDQEVADNLYLLARNENSKPFLEHDDIVKAMRLSVSQPQSHLQTSLSHNFNARNHDEDIAMSNHSGNYKIAAVVFFAPYPSKHPQYAFAHMQDAWDFVSATSSSFLDFGNIPDPDWSINTLSLVCSASVKSVKSALTHSNVEEASLITVQVWERDTSGDMYPTAGRARQPTQKRNNYERFIRIFRNKSPLANAPAPPATATSAASGRNTQISLHSNALVLDIDCKFLKPPETERRTGKVIFAFRDISTGEGVFQHGLGTVLKEMKYLKMAFEDDEAKREFLHEAGFGS